MGRNLLQILTFNVFFLMHPLVVAQNNTETKKIDSLILALERAPNANFSLLCLKDIVYESNSPDTILVYARRYYQLAKSEGSLEHQSHALGSLGAYFQLVGIYDSALSYTFQGLGIAKEIKNYSVLHNANITLANTYLSTENYQQAIFYFHQALLASRHQLIHKSDEIESNKVDTATVYNNLGELFNYQGQFDSALYCYNVAVKDFYRLNNSLGLAYAIGNIGTVYAQTNKHELAKQHIDSAVHILEGLEDMYPISIYLTYMSDIYHEAGDFKRALEYLEESLQIAKAHKLREQQRDAHQAIAALYESTGKFDSAYRYQTLYYVFKDSVENVATVKNIAEIRADFQVSQKQREVDLLHETAKNQRLIALLLGLGVCFTIASTVFFYKRNRERALANRQITQQKDDLEQAYGLIQQEQEKSESLLLNILPKETAAELKSTGKATPRHYEMVSILFTDFKGFTQLAEQLSPEEVVAELNYCYGRFDEICEEYNIEKIKTIGDAYMCVGGIPTPNTTNPHDIIACALAMQEFMENWKTEKRAKGLPVWDLRLGVHTGRIIAGVVGKKKFAYDIWGDAVNLASRMESSGKPGQINISGDTYELIKDQFNCQYRGKVPAKNKGEVDMYFVSGKK